MTHSEYIKAVQEELTKRGVTITLSSVSLKNQFEQNMAVSEAADFIQRQVAPIKDKGLLRRLGR